MFVVIKSSQIKPVADPKIKLKGQNIKVAGYGVALYIYKEMGEFVGLDVDILPILADKYDFSFTVIGSNGWGQPSENGTWSGTIGEVYYVHDIFIYIFFYKKNDLHVLAWYQHQQTFQQCFYQFSTGQPILKWYGMSSCDL
jgi:hypothetical protein